jgi:hypothetical protein
MADARVGRCDPSAAHGIAAHAGHAIVQALLLPRQEGAQGPELVSGRGIPWLHALQAPADPLHCTPEEPCPRGLTPGLVPLGMVPLRPRGPRSTGALPGASSTSATAEWNSAGPGFPIHRAPSAMPPR